MILNLIETLETSIYNPKHTQNTKIHFNFSKKYKNSKKKTGGISSKYQCFMLICIALFILLRATQPN